MSDEDFVITVVDDRPPGGMWHCGPNPCWVTVKHVQTQIMARAYHRSQRKAREMAMACVEMMIADARAERDSCNFPEALGEAQ
jgi:hypothetical protein